MSYEYTTPGRRKGDGLWFWLVLLFLLIFGGLAWGLAQDVQDWRYKQAVIDLAHKP